MNVFVAGAGTMGLDIAQLLARADCSVVIRDISEDIIQTAAARLENTLSKQIEKGNITATESESILQQIRFTTSLESAENADLVLEAVVERVDIKIGLFRELDAICGSSCIFCSNTSAISITQMAASTGRPDRFIGMHFFNPALTMPLVEIIRAPATSDETYNTVYELACRLGKDPVEVQDSPGFVVNRILAPMMNEAICLLYENTASAEDIDKAMRLGANHPMGPLHLADLIGLDVLLHVLDVLFEETHDPKFRACYLLRKMVRSGYLGRKTGRGFFRYENRK